MELVKQVVIRDIDGWAKDHVTSQNMEDHPNIQPLQYIGGVDISFRIGDNINACATLVVLKLPELKVYIPQSQHDISDQHNIY